MTDKIQEKKKRINWCYFKTLSVVFNDFCDCMHSCRKYKKCLGLM